MVGTAAELRIVQVNVLSEERSIEFNLKELFVALLDFQGTLVAASKSGKTGCTVLGVLDIQGQIISTLILGDSLGLQRTLLGLCFL